ncbi:MAG TPA: DoxX family protein [Algoriphagus sp.]|nr:DoxX family protein [Algoriphagus sp.]
MKQLDSYFEKHKDKGILILRIFLGSRLLFGVVDNVLSWRSMIEFSEFLASFHFPIPVMSAVMSVYAQFICAFMILTGFHVRIASIFMILNFLIALTFVHFANGDSIEQMTPAFAMLFGSMTLLFTGAGRKFSISE